MSKNAVYDALRIRTSQDGQIKGFTQEAMVQTGQAHVRQTLRHMGYGNQKVKFTDPKLIARYEQFAAVKAQTLRTGYNRFLKSALDGQDPSLTDAQRMAGLSDFHARAKQWNQGAGKTYVMNTAKSIAQEAFYAGNPLITGTWTAEGTLSCPLCQAAAAGDRDQDLPAHYNCGCGWVFTVDGPLPTVDTLYTGQAPDEEKRAPMVARLKRAGMAVAVAASA